MNNLNPILTALMLLNFLDNIEKAYNVTQFRVVHLHDIVEEQVRAIFVNLYMPLEIRAQVKQRDLFNKDALFYMEKLDSFHLMDTKVMDRIMKDYWNSNIDTTGKVMGTSTCYNILTKHHLTSLEDYERRNRFNVKREVGNMRPHPYMFKVYVISMQMRYFMEVIFFTTLSIVF